jgi:polyphosphate glucokinase
MTARDMVDGVRRATAGWEYSAVALGYPGPVIRNRPVEEPHNLGKGWVGFDYGKAFRRPVRIVNDAALQALGSYRGGRMLFLGLGSGLGSTLIVEGILHPLELAHLPYRNGKTFEDYLGQRARERLGLKKWLKHVARAVALLKAGLRADDVVIGGGNVRHVKTLPPGARRGRNANALRGGHRLWRSDSPG